MINLKEGVYKHEKNKFKLLYQLILIVSLTFLSISSVFANPNEQPVKVAVTQVFINGDDSKTITSAQISKMQNYTDNILAGNNFTIINFPVDSKVIQVFEKDFEEGTRLMVNLAKNTGADYIVIRYLNKQIGWTPQMGFYALEINCGINVYPDQKLKAELHWIRNADLTYLIEKNDIHSRGIVAAMVKRDLLNDDNWME